MSNLDGQAVRTETATKETHSQKIVAMSSPKSHSHFCNSALLINSSAQLSNWKRSLEHEDGPPQSGSNRSCSAASLGGRARRRIQKRSRQRDASQRRQRLQSNSKS